MMTEGNLTTHEAWLAHAAELVESGNLPRGDLDLLQALVYMQQRKASPHPSKWGSLHG